MNKPYLAVLFASLLFSAAMLGGFYVGLSSFTGSQTGLSWYAGSPSSYTYIVDTNGTHFFAYNGTTNYLEVSGASANTVLQTLFNVSETRNASIFIRRGLYSGLHLLLPNVTTYTTPVALILQGEGRGATVLQALASYNLINSQGSSFVTETPNRYLIVSDLTLIGNSTGGDVSTVKPTYWNIHFTRVRFEGTTGNNAYCIAGGAINAGGAPANPSSLEDCIFVHEGGSLYAGICYLWYEALEIRNPTFVLTGNDIRWVIQLAGTNVKITNMIIHSASGIDITYAALYSIGAMGINVDGLYYNQNGAVKPVYKLLRIGNNETRASLKDIRVEFETNCINFSRIFYNEYTQNRTILSGYCGDFFFENQGVVTGATNATTVTHRLPTTPYVVIAQSQNDTYSIHVHAATYTTTTFTLICTDMAGNVVTGQTIVWWATTNIHW